MSQIWGNFETKQVPKRRSNSWFAVGSVVIFSCPLSTVQSNLLSISLFSMHTNRTKCKQQFALFRKKVEAINLVLSEENHCLLLDSNPHCRQCNVRIASRICSDAVMSNQRAGLISHLGIVYFNPIWKGFLNIPVGLANSYGPILWSSEDLKVIVGLRHKQTYAPAQISPGCW